MENPDDARACRSCGTQLSPPPVPPGDIVPKTSKLAIAAFVLAVLGPFTLGITLVPAVIVSILSIVVINRSGGRLTGGNFAILGIVIPLVLFLLAGMLMPAFLHEREHAFRMVCGTNLSRIGKAMLIYSNDYDDQLPRSGSKESRWAMKISDWKAGNRFAAYGLTADGSGGQGSISSCFYLLVKYAEVEPKYFICRGDSRTTEFKSAKYLRGETELADLWDFGPDPTKHCSYSYHQPFGDFPLTTSRDPGMAVAADRNPWMASPASEGKSAQFALFNPDGNRAAHKIGNAIQHKEDGQNVLFLDSHVGFEKNPFCAVNDDNIYTFWDGGDIRRGGLPVGGRSEPKGELDSFLVHDGH
jgi:hypothetical protein